MRLFLLVACLVLGTSSARAEQANSVLHSTYTVSPWQCEADWDEDCEDSTTLTAPDGYQVCRFTFDEVTSDGWDAWFRHEPTSFYANDPQSPDRFRAVTLYIHAFGTGNPLDQRGSKERVENITFDLIPAEADNNTRYIEGCDMPLHD